MAKVVKLKWTDLQREIATSAREGGGRTFDELVQLGYTKSLVSKVLNAVKAGQKPPEKGEGRPDNQEPKPFKGGTATGPITVGRITITPENWGFTQYGAILILDTYHQAKRDINYGGTIGEFLCDITVFYRRLVNYKEVQHGGGDGEGGSSTEEDGRTSPEPSRELVPQQ